jgi:hypothetical protein
MAFQKEVKDSQPLGWPGQFYDASPRRVTAYSLPGMENIPEAVGKVFTLGSDRVPQLGGDGAFAGILCHPISLGRLGFDAVTDVAAGEMLELADMGRIIIRSSAAADPGMPVYYDPENGRIAGPGENGGLIRIPGASYILFHVDDGGLGVIGIDPGMTIVNNIDPGE